MCEIIKASKPASVLPSFDGLRQVLKPDSYLDLGDVDIAELQKWVAGLSDKVWAQEDAKKENDFAVLRNTQHIIFRFIPIHDDPRNHYSNPIWDIWKTMLVPLMDRVARGYRHREAMYPKVMLARLPAGEHISRHKDGGGSNLYTHKVHVPLMTNSGAMFLVNETARHLEVGRGYEVNNLAYHAAENKGDTDRIHLIFEHLDCADAPF